MRLVWLYFTSVCSSGGAKPRCPFGGCSWAPDCGRCRSFGRGGEVEREWSLPSRSAYQRPGSGWGRPLISPTRADSPPPGLPRQADAAEGLRSDAGDRARRGRRLARLGRAARTDARVGAETGRNAHHNSWAPAPSRPAAGGEHAGGRSTRAAAVQGGVAPSSIGIFRRCVQAMALGTRLRHRHGSDKAAER